MQRTIFDAEHDQFRNAVREFVEREILPHYLDWEHAGIAPRSLYEAAGRTGILGLAVPQEYGGGGTSDFRFNAIVGEEFAAAGVGGAGLGITAHNDVVTPYFVGLSTEEQARRWLPGLADGSLIGALAMTEPGTGSDLKAIRTVAHKVSQGYELSGSKTFITNGINSDVVIVAARTGTGGQAGRFSLLVVERGMAGFARGRKLDKIGLRSQDTAELHFDRVFVPETNLLGEEGRGLQYLMGNLAEERLSIAVGAVGYARTAANWALEYVKERRAFGKPIGSFQNTKFVLAEAFATVEATQSFIDRCIVALTENTLTESEAAMAKWLATDLQKQTVDRCLQLFGGYGYMIEYPIARAYLDARVAPIYGGTNEIMKVIVAKSLGLLQTSLGVHLRSTILRYRSQCLLYVRTLPDLQVAFGLQLHERCERQFLSVDEVALQGA